MEKSIKLRLRIDYKAMKYYNMYNLLYRKRFVLFYIILAVVCVLGSAASFIGNNVPFLKSEPNLMLGVIFLLFTIYLVYQSVNLEKTIDRNIVNYFYNRNPIEQDLTITDETITISSPTDPEKSVIYDWIQVTNIHEINQYYYLYLGKQPIIVDKSAEAVLEGNHEDLFAIINEKASVKPFKRVDKEIVKTPITYVHQSFVEEVEEAEEVEVEEVEEIKVETQDNIEEAGNTEEKEWLKQNSLIQKQK